MSSDIPIHFLRIREKVSRIILGKKEKSRIVAGKTQDRSMTRTVNDSPVLLQDIPNSVSSTSIDKNHSKTYINWTAEGERYNW